MEGDILLLIRQRMANMGFDPNDFVIREQQVAMNAGETYEALTNGDYWYLSEVSNYDGKWKMESDVSITFEDDFIMNGKLNMMPVENYGNLYIRTEANVTDPETEETSDNSNKFVFFVAQTGRLVGEKK